MGKIVTVDYKNLKKKSVGRPKRNDRKEIKTVKATIQSDYCKGYSKIKFKISNGNPMVYFTNRETENILPDNQYISSIKNNSFNIPDCGLHGKYIIEPCGYNWFKLLKNNKENNFIEINWHNMKLC